MSEFSIEEKIQCFDKIYKAYYLQNFGTMAKVDIETLLFSEFLEHCMNCGEPYDDYTISKKLGITQSRVRSLKERKELRYPYLNNWKNQFTIAAQNAKYDENDHYIKFIIEDVNVLMEVRHYIEQKGWYDECSLNRKLLRIPLACYIDICLKDESVTDLFSDEALQKVKKISKTESDKALSQFVSEFNQEGLKSFVMCAGKQLICEVLKTILPFGGAISGMLNLIVKIIEKG